MNLTYETKRKLLGFTFLIPYLLGFLMFFAVPLGQTVYYSFQKIDVPEQGGMSFTFLGLQNYIDLFATEVSTLDSNVQILRVLLEKWKQECWERKIPCNTVNVGCMMSYMNYTPRTLAEILAANPVYAKAKRGKQL